MKRALLVFLITSLCDFWQPVLADSGSLEQVKIGVVAPLTGQFSYVGKEITRTVNILSDSFRQKSSKYSYKFLFEDGKCGVGHFAATAAKKLIDIDNVKFLISGCSGETLKIAPFAESKKILLMAVYSNHKDVKEAGDFVFRTFVDVERGIEEITSVIRKDGNIPVALISEDNSYTQGMKNLIQKYLSGDIILMEDFAPDETDFRTLLLKAISAKVKGLYLNCAGPKTCSNLINQARSYNIGQQIYTFHHAEHPELIATCGANLNGIKFLTTPLVSSNSTDFRDFQSEYRDRFKEQPSQNFLLRTTYDGLMALFNAIERFGPVPIQVRDYLYTYQTEGALGNISFDKNGDIEGIRHVVKTVDVE